jgi:hypothetical protein
MAGTQFSSDSARAGPGRPSRGVQDRRIDRQQRHAAPKAPAKGQAPAGAPRGEGPHLGFPQAQQQPEPEQAPPDLRHVQLLSQHVNMQGLGRESLFGNRVAINGDWRQVLGAGRVPFDIFEDL